VPGVAETAAAPVLGGGLGLQGPCALASGEVREPLEKAGAAVEPQPELSAKPPRALGGGALESRQDQIGEGLPGAALGQLDQWRGGVRPRWARAAYSRGCRVQSNRGSGGGGLLGCRWSWAVGQ
jgi:hypothetical protein